MFRLRSWLVGLFAIALSTTLFLQACGPASTQAQSPRPEATLTDRMAQEHQGDKPIATEVSRMDPAQPVTTEEVEYATIGDQVVKGFLAKPEVATEPLPAIIAIHEWWGLNDNIRAIAQRLAGEGYTVLAVDLYNGQVAEQPDQARTLMQSVMQTPEPAQENLKQAYGYLTTAQQATKVGSIGWCFGGGWSLRTGLLLPQDLDALVMYYGQVVTDQAKLETLEMPIAGFFAGQDQGIPVADVKAFEAALQDLNKPAEIYIYEDADHAFANPSGTRYNAEAAMDAWEKTVAFFAETLKA